MSLQFKSTIELEKVNHILIRHLSSMVSRGVGGRVEVNFKMVEHTNVKVDQFFSRCV